MFEDIQGIFFTAFIFYFDAIILSFFDLEPKLNNILH